jgi:hypothetical protein
MMALPKAMTPNAWAALALDDAWQRVQLIDINRKVAGGSQILRRLPSDLRC